MEDWAKKQNMEAKDKIIHETFFSLLFHHSYNLWNIHKKKKISQIINK